MKILTINFGHDASLGVFEEGKLIDFVEVERESRLKHHFGLETQFVESYLSRIGYEFKDIDLVALSGTQQWGMFHDERIQINFGYQTGLHDSVGIKNEPHWSENNFQFYQSYAAAVYGKHVEKQKLRASHSPVRTSWRHNFARNFSNSPASIGSLAQGALSLDSETTKNYWSYFLAPYSFSIDGITKPALHSDHHFAHANYAYFYTNQLSLAVTHDGGVNAAPFNSGGVYILVPNLGVIPVLAHGLTLGNIYDSIASIYKIDAGKLMGLASYGRPSRHVNSVAEKYMDNLFYGVSMPTNSVVHMLLGTAASQFKLRNAWLEKFEFDFDDTPMAVQAAANTQHFVQRVYVDLISPVCDDIKSMVPEIDTVFTTGGFSLNCPTNSELNFANNNLNFVPLPGVGDTGLAIGAAVATHTFLGHDLDMTHLQTKMSPAFPPSALKADKKDESPVPLQQVPVDNLISFTADQLADGAVICLHRGRSEVGPRALGNRSIIAWAGTEEVRDRINASKGREAWRPLAPMVRAEDFHDYFYGDPDHCRFMLTVSKVKSNCIPAVTHVDNTARVQVIDSGDVFLNQVLAALKARGVAPVIVNTSFNCAGEPLVEGFSGAAKSFYKMSFDLLISEEDVFKCPASN